MNRAPFTFRILAADGALIRSGRIDPAAMQARFDTEGAHLTIRALRAANRGQPGPIGGGLILVAFGVIAAFATAIARGAM